MDDAKDMEINKPSSSAPKTTMRVLGASSTMGRERLLRFLPLAGAAVSSGYAGKDDDLLVTRSDSLSIDSGPPFWRSAMSTVDNGTFCISVW